MSHDLPLAVALNGYGLTSPRGSWREMLRWEDLRGLAALSERLGYGSVFVPEIGGREAFATIAGFAAATERIHLASGVIPLRARDDRRIAMGASSLFEQSGGRFILGLGSDLSIEETRRRVSVIRQLIRGDEALLDDPEEGYLVGVQDRIDWWISAQPAPIWLAALGPRMVELGGEVGDGLILNWCTPGRVAEARAAVTTRRVQIAVYVRACLGGDAAGRTDALRLEASRYVRLGPYARQFRAMGLWDAVDRPGLADLAVEATCLPTDVDGALARLTEYRDAGADEVVVYPVAAADAVPSMRETMTALAPAAPT